MRGWPKIVQRDDACDDGRQGRGDLRVGGVGHMGFVVYKEVMNLGVESAAHLGDVAGEFDDRTAGTNFNVRETLRGEPLGHGLDVGVGGPKLSAELLRGEPCVVVRGGLALLIVEQLAEGGLLIRAALQEQQYTVQRLSIRDSTLIKFRAGEWMDVARQDEESLFIDGLRDARRDVGALRRGAQATE